jgi:shikimate kinase
MSGSLAVEVVVLNGSAGAGKSTVAGELSEVLREDDVPHAVLDVDELARVFPWEQAGDLKWRNVAAVFPSFARISDCIKVVLPVLIDTDDDLAALRNATPCDRFVVCELIADKETLLERVNAREPNEFWRSQLRHLVELYAERPTSQKFADFQVRTDRSTPRSTALEIAAHLGWTAPPIAS